MGKLPGRWEEDVFRDVSDRAVPRKVDIRLPGEVNSNSHGARPVHQIISMVKWLQGLATTSLLATTFHLRQLSLADRVLHQ